MKGRGRFRRDPRQLGEGPHGGCAGGEAGLPVGWDLGLSRTGFVRQLGRVWGLQWASRFVALKLRDEV